MTEGHISPGVTYHRDTGNLLCHCVTGTATQPAAMLAIWICIVICVAKTFGLSCVILYSDRNVIVFFPLALAIADSPVSVSALVRENALFHCNGSGIAIAWIVDGILATDTSITAHGITDHTVSSSGTIQSTLTVPATSVNNGTTVQCIVLSLSGSVTSNNATLTVITGKLW